MSDSPAPAVPMLDRATGVPLYTQIRDALRGQIVSRALAPGAALPTEEELQHRFGVSRSVVRQALGELADAGLVERRRGRGSVVLPTGEHRRRAEQAGGLLGQVEAAGRRLSTSIVSLEAQTAPDGAVEMLGSDDTWRLERVRRIDGEPVIFMRTWVPRAPFPGLSAEALDGGSLLDWMRSTGAEPAGGPRQVQAVAADESVAHHLGLGHGEPVLLLTGVTQDVDGRGLEWFSAWHRPTTVFDVDARVEAAALDPARASRVRALLRELADLVDPPS